MTVEPSSYGGLAGGRPSSGAGQRCARPHAKSSAAPPHAVLMSVDPATLYLALPCRCRLVPVWVSHRPAGQDRDKVKPLYLLLVNKFYFDELYVFVFAGGTRASASLLAGGGCTSSTPSAITAPPTASAGRRRAAPRPVGLPLSLRLRHDHRTLSVCSAGS